MDKDVNCYRFASLPFGLRSSSKLFQDTADCLKHICVKNGASTSTISYLDDSLTIANTFHECEKSLGIIVRTSESCGFNVQYKKLAGPSKKLEFLGICIDTVRKELSISEARLNDILQELEKWLSKSHATKRQILSIIGKLQFCAKVVRSGVMFIRRLIQCSKKLKNLHNVAKLSYETKKDLKWWFHCIRSHNGMTWFKKEFDPSSATLLFTDASDLGAGMVVDCKWAIFPFSGKNGWMTKKSIQWRELFAVLLAMSTFSHYLAGKEVLMNIDNQAMQVAVANGKSKEPELMAMIRVIYFYTSVHHINYQTVYISSANNSAADACSRLDVTRLRACLPGAEKSMTLIGKYMFDF